MQRSDATMVERPRPGRTVKVVRALLHTHTRSFSTFYVFATSSRSFCRERCLGTLFYSEICPFSHKNEKITVFLSHRVIHPMHTSLQGARPKRITRSGAEGKATSHRNSLSGCHTLFSSVPNHQSHFGPDFTGIRPSSLIGHTISYSI